MTIIETGVSRNTASRAPCRNTCLGFNWI